MIEVCYRFETSQCYRSETSQML